MLELLTRGSRGLPAELQRLANLSAQTARASVADIRRTLGLDWPSAIPKIIPRVLAEFDAMLPGFPTMAVSKRTRARILEVLTEIYLRLRMPASLYSPSTAMHFTEVEARSTMVGVFETISRSLGYDASEMWEDVSAQFLFDLVFRHRNFTRLRAVPAQG